MRAIFLGLIILSFIPRGLAAEAWDVLTETEKQTLHRILDHWESWVPERKAAGSAPMISFEELYAGISEEETGFLDRVRAVDPQVSFGFRGAHLGSEAEGITFERIDGQEIHRGDEKEAIDPQYLPSPVQQVYEEMMQAMAADLGKRLLVESGYRSPAYQLYTFLFYTPKHEYSLAETGHWVALPGYSEHGAPHQQAIDFINQEGINGEDHVEEFEGLPEYRWLQEHADKFHFRLSYPRGQEGITFEPWHWAWCSQCIEVSWTDEEAQGEVAVRQLRRTEKASYHMVRLRTREVAHVHKTHDLTIFMTKGAGRVHMAGRVLDLVPGDTAFIPKDTIHWGENIGPGASEVYAIFTPPFDGQDSHEDVTSLA
ncbi:MAG: D-alanyl-D-alanine carboxypeptidase family protein [Candidatus Omnitrophota bacterium]|nr:D-alanyl-D-alanine carboxypeptidase family protein [Candidatus Omnitrophota bacterium]